MAPKPQTKANAAAAGVAGKAERRNFPADGADGALSRALSLSLSLCRSLSFSFSLFLSPPLPSHPSSLSLLASLLRNIPMFNLRNVLLSFFSGMGHRPSGMGLEIQPHVVKSLRLSYMGLYPQNTSKPLLSGKLPSLHIHRHRPCWSAAASCLCICAE